jgi:ribosomal protein S18 acetylase RimI-like enzyme
MDAPTTSTIRRSVPGTGHGTDAGEQGIAHAPVGDPFEDVEGADRRRPAGPGTTIGGMESHPVVLASWNGAHARCGRAGRRVPRHRPSRSRPPAYPGAIARAFPVRPYRPSDARAVCAFFASAHRRDREVGAVTPARWRACTGHASVAGGRDFLVAVEGGRVVGLLASFLPRGRGGGRTRRHFRIVVHPSLRRRGIGGALLRLLEAQPLPGPRPLLQTLLPAAWLRIFRAAFRGDPPGARSWVAVRGRRPVGICLVHRADGKPFLQSLAVDEAARGRGLARALLRTALRALRRGGGGPVGIETGDRDRAARRPYESVGFRPAGGQVALWRAGGAPIPARPRPVR